MSSSFELAVRQLDYWATVYRRTWKGTVVSSFVNPLLYLKSEGRLPLPGAKKSIAAPAGGGGEWGQIRSQQAPPLLDAKGRPMPPDVRAMVSRMDANKEAQKVQ